MLPIYKAIAVNQEAIIGGSTKPCLMTVVNKKEKIVGEYVVKVFKQNNILQNHSTTKEVLGNILAKEFGLNVPQAALVIVNQEIISGLKKESKISKTLISFLVFTLVVNT